MTNMARKIQSIRLCISIISLIVLIGCSNVAVCPPDKQLGSVSFGNNTLAQLPYARAGTIQHTYSASNGNTVTLSATARPSTSRLCYNQCTEPLQPINPNSTCEYLSSEAVSYVFRNSDSSIVIDILYGQEAYVDSNEDYIDFLRLANKYLITDQSFSEAIDLRRTIIGTSDRLLNAGSTQTINGTTYNNVITTQDSLRTLYYSTSKGLVGFTYQGQTYNLQ